MNLFEYLKVRKTKNYEDYKKDLKLNKNDIVRFSEYLSDASKKLHEAMMSQNKRDIDYYKSQVNKWKYELDKSIKITEFIRCNDDLEIAKRNIIGNTFADNLKTIVGENSNLRFHGTSIYFAKEIINDGKITSSADRHDGYLTSTDESGYISASTINSLSRTINYFTDFASYNRSLPCGILFVLNEIDDDFKLRDRSEMHNVDFKKNPEQLVGIVCTDEVKEKVEKWCMNANIDLNKVFTYDSFLEYAKNKGKKL